MMQKPSWKQLHEAIWPAVEQVESRPAVVLRYVPVDSPQLSGDGIREFAQMKVVYIDTPGEPMIEALSALSRQGMAVVWPYAATIAQLAMLIPIQHGSGQTLWDAIDE